MQYRHLTLRDREVIQKMKDQRFSQKKIAQKIGFSESTISRELKRYKVNKEYYSNTVQGISDFRRAAANQLRRKIYNRALIRYILYCLKKRYSPEQISGRLERLYPDDPSRNISHETIYQILYKLFKTEKLDFTPSLRRKKVNYRQKRAKRAKSMTEQNKKSIHTRDEEINSNPAVGHWEGDTIEGKKNSGFIATHVDRKTKYTIAAKMENKRADTFNRVVKDSFADYDEIKTITYDNGTEMSGFQELEEILDCQIYFADPGKPGQRGLNENTNGLLRQYFKKGSDFRKITQKNVDRAVHALNHRPRKCLGYLTPYEMFFKKG